jgi:hypothetical protein
MPATPTPEIGVFLPSISGPDDRPGDMAATARHAEELGLESAWVVVVEGRARLAELADARGCPTPSVTGSMVVALTGDPALPDHDGLVRMLTAPDGVFGMPADQVPSVLTLGGPAEVAARFAEYGEAGAERVVVTVAAGDWMRQAELLAEAAALLG